MEHGNYPIFVLTITQKIIDKIAPRFLLRMNAHYQVLSEGDYDHS